jgi:uncharacterized membrane protein YgcG
MSHRSHTPSADPAWRFSLLSLLVLLAAAGWGAAALVNASELWVSLTFSATAGLLALAVLVAVFRRGGARAFAIGFAVCGWLYLLLCHWPDHSNNVFSAIGRAESKLITRTVTNYVYFNWLPKVKSPPDMNSGGGGGGFGGGGLNGGGFGGGGMGGIVGGGSEAAASASAAKWRPAAARHPPERREPPRPIRSRSTLSKSPIRSGRSSPP